MYRRNSLFAFSFPFSLVFLHLLRPLTELFPFIFFSQPRFLVFAGCQISKFLFQLEVALKSLAPESAFSECLLNSTTWLRLVAAVSKSASGGKLLNILEVLSHILSINPHLKLTHTRIVNDHSPVG